MSGLVKRAFFFTFFLFVCPTGYGFIHESVRIRSLGSDFTGLIEDPYTDVFRNPAYLAKWEKAVMMAEIRNPANSTFLSNLVIPIQGFKLGVGYEILAHSSGTSPQQSQNFSGQRTVYDLYPLYGVYLNGPRRFQTPKAIVAKSTGRFSFGLDFQYLHDRAFNKPEDTLRLYGNYNQIPTTFQIRGGSIYTLKSNWTLDAIVRYQRDRQRIDVLTARSSFDPGYNYQDSYTTKASGHLNEIGAAISLRFSPHHSIGVVAIFSGERVKGELPITILHQDTTSYTYSTPFYFRNRTSAIDTTIQHFQWRYKAGLSISKTFPQQITAFGGMKLSITRQREFYSATAIASNREWRDTALTRNDQQTLSSSGEINSKTLTELSAPIALEYQPKGILILRFGMRPLLTLDSPDKGSRKVDFTSLYTLGFGGSFQDHIVFDVYMANDLSNLNNWQIALRYLF